MPDTKKSKQDIMWLESTLEKLSVMLLKWGLSNNDWCLVGEYAWQINGYDVELRENHLDIFIKSKKLPWRVPEGAESTIPPQDTQEMKEFMKFMVDTKADPHFLPLPLGPVLPEEITRGSYLYPLSGINKIRIYKPIAELEGRNRILQHDPIVTAWDKDKLERWIEFHGEIRRIACRQKDSGEIMRACDEGLKIMESLRRKIKTGGEEKPQNVTDGIHGLSGCAGKAKGKVKIVLSPQEIASLSQGDVLVAPMTTPAYLVGIKKAVAIVTDKGGILCHAAVISREFGIPCVVGTGVATQVLRNGDLVEVNANKGIIKKL